MNKKNILLICVLLSSWGLFSEKLPFEVKKILFVGDSITKHGPAEKLGWSGSWGMAATAEANDYVHLVHARISAAQGSAPELIVHGLGGGTIPGKLAEGEKLSAMKADLIIVQMGENDKDVSPSGFLKPYDDLIALLRAANPSSRILCTGTWSPPGGSPVKDAMIREVCRKYKLPFVDLGAANAEKNNLASSTGRWAHPGVGWHPSDAGMKAYADAIWLALSKGDAAIPSAEEVPKSTQTTGIVFAEDFEGASSLGAWSPAIATREAGERGQALRLNADGKKSAITFLSLSTEKLNGKNILITARARAEHIAGRQKSAEGARWFLETMDAEGVRDSHAAQIPDGDFSWTELKLSLAVPDNIVSARLGFGLEGVSGSIWIDDIQIEEKAGSPDVVLLKEWSVAGLKNLPESFGSYQLKDQAAFEIKTLPDQETPAGKGAVEIAILKTSARENDSDLQFFPLYGGELTARTSYRISFWMKASSSETFRTGVIQNESPWGPVGEPRNLTFTAVAEWKYFVYDFKTGAAEPKKTRLPLFMLGKCRAGQQLWIGKIKLEKKG